MSPVVASDVAKDGMRASKSRRRDHHRSIAVHGLPSARRRRHRAPSPVRALSVRALSFRKKDAQKPLSPGFLLNFSKPDRQTDRQTEAADGAHQWARKMGRRPWRAIDMQYSWRKATLTRGQTSSDPAFVVRHPRRALPALAQGVSACRVSWRGP